MLSRMEKDILIHLEKFKVITIKQCKSIFYGQGDYDYDYARKKLREMEKESLVKSYVNALTKEKVYYVEDKISAHDLYILDFYAKLHEYGCQDIEMKKTPKYLKGLIIPDALFQFKFDGDMYFVLLEVDLTHFTGMSKFQMYEKLYKENELQSQCYGTFPQIVVMGVNTIRYNSRNFETVFTDFGLSNFRDVLGLID